MCLGADLRALDVMFGRLAVPRIVELVDHLRVDLIPVRLVAARFQNEVGDTQTMTGVAKTGLLVHKRTTGNSRDISLLSDHRFETICVQLDLVLILHQPEKETSEPRKETATNGRK